MNNKQFQAGVGLIEVLMALLVLAIGVLGYAGMQLTALKAAEDANYRAMATLLAQDAMERFQANETEMATYTTLNQWPAATQAPGSAPADVDACVSAVCSPARLAAWDIQQLSWSAANLLPAGMIAAAPCMGANNISCVLVSWNEQQPSSCMDAGGVNVNDDASCVVLEVSR